MQAPTTLTRGNGFNRLTAGAIGLALLAASTIGAIALNDQVELPLISSDGQAQPVVRTDPMAQIQLIEQNGFDYAAAEPVDALFLEENSWDHQPVANYATIGRIRLIEQNSFDYATPVTTSQIRFVEENGWDWTERAGLAGGESAPAAAPDFRFLEENVWETQSQMIPPADNGATDY